MKLTPNARLNSWNNTTIHVTWMFFGNCMAVVIFIVMILTRFLHLSKRILANKHMVQVVGEVGEGISGIEASLDTQYILSTGNNITTWFWWVLYRLRTMILNQFYLKIFIYEGIQQADTNSKNHFFSGSSIYPILKMPHWSILLLTPIKKEPLIQIIWLE